MMQHGGFRLDAGDVRLSAVDPRLYRRMWAFVRPHRHRLLLAVILMVLGALANLAGPYLLKLALDRQIPARDWAGLNLLALLYAGAAVAQFGAAYGQTWLVSAVGQSVIHDLRSQMFRHLQRLGLRFFDRTASGRIVARLTSDVDSIQQVIAQGLVSLLGDGLLLAAIAAAMFNLNWRLALVSMVTVPLMIGFLRWIKARLREAFMEVRRRQADITANLAESISGVRVTQSFAREGHNREQFQQVNLQAQSAQLESTRIWAMFFPAVEVIGALGVALVVSYGGWQARLGAGVTAGDLAAFTMLLQRFFGPMRDLSMVYNVLQSAVVSAERVVELLDQAPELTDAPGAPPLPPVAGRVRFEAVTFGYEPDQPVLRQVSLQAEPGETIALVGPTGAGKSSIINLLARFYDPQAGRITVDGHDLRAVQLRSWRQQIGLVLQESFLFTGTIMENIRYGRPEATDAECIAAARTVGADEFIERLPDGYQSRVQERGGGLSIGQRQLIAFARALAANPRILILDEATAHVDSYTEARLQAALERLLHGRTAFVIAHRLSTIRRADRIYFIDEGQVAEEGTHDQLLARGGRYAELWAKLTEPAPVGEGADPFFTTDDAD